MAMGMASTRAWGTGRGRGHAHARAGAGCRVLIAPPLLLRCATGAGRDATVLENCHSTFSQAGKYKAYIKPKKASNSTFIINHYAGEVIYTIGGFVEKNKDELSADITALLEVHIHMPTPCMYTRVHPHVYGMYALGRHHRAA